MRAASSALRQWRRRWVGQEYREFLSRLGQGGKYVAGSERAQQDMAHCLAPFERPQALWVLVGLAVLLAVAVALALATPGWIRRRDRLVEATPPSTADVRTRGRT